MVDTLPLDRVEVSDQAIHATRRSPKSLNGVLMMSEKLCVFCKHFQLGTDGYETSGYYGVIECWKNHWPMQSSIPSRETLVMAETCRDYEEDS